MSAAPETTDTFADAQHRYRLDARIATGGMGEVWRGTDTVLGRPVAVKVLKPEYADDELFRQRFTAEARNAAALHHPHVAAVFDFGDKARDDGSGAVAPYLVMELVDGEPLSALLRGGEAMPADRARSIAVQAADGLAAAHARGIVHRDVKPANLLVTGDGALKITDFGIARAADASPLTQTGQVIGTPHYLSPEQASGQEATPASDVYGLGVVLFECLAGRRPFAGETPVATALAHLREPVPELPRDVPADLRATVARSLAKEPTERFADAGEMARALRGRDVPAASSTRLLTGLVGGLGGAGAATPSSTGSTTDGSATAETSVLARRRRPLPVWWPLAGVVALVLLVVGVATALDGGSEPASSNEPTGRSGTSGAGRSGSTSDTSSPEPSGVLLRESRFLGRPKDEVKKALEGRGFTVDEEKVPGEVGHEKDTVAGLDPSGRVEPRSEITMSVYEEYKPPPEEAPTKEAPGHSEQHGKPGKGKAKGHD